MGYCMLNPFAQIALLANAHCKESLVWFELLWHHQYWILTRTPIVALHHEDPAALEQSSRKPDWSEWPRENRWVPKWVQGQDTLACFFARGVNDATVDWLLPYCFEWISITKLFSGKGTLQDLTSMDPPSSAFRETEGTFWSRFFLEKPSVDLLWEMKLVLFSLINHSALFPKANVALRPPRHRLCCEGEGLKLSPGPTQPCFLHPVRSAEFRLLPFFLCDFCPVEPDL